MTYPPSHSPASPLPLCTQVRLFLNQVWPHSTRADHLQDLIAVRLTSINQIIDPWAYIICRKVRTRGEEQQEEDEDEEKEEEEEQGKVEGGGMSQ